MKKIKDFKKRVLEEYPDYICNLFFEDGLSYGEIVDDPSIKVSIHNTHH